MPLLEDVSYENAKCLKFKTCLETHNYTFSIVVTLVGFRGFVLPFATMRVLIVLFVSLVFGIVVLIENAHVQVIQPDYREGQQKWL